MTALSDEDVIAWLLRHFPSGGIEIPGMKRRRWGREDPSWLREYVWRVFGAVCLMCNNRRRPLTECAHIDDWDATIRRIVIGHELGDRLGLLATAGEPDPEAREIIHGYLLDWFNRIDNVIPLCRTCHPAYDKSRTITRHAILQRRHDVLLLPRVIENVMQTLEAACYGRLSKQVILQEPWRNQHTLFGWVVHAYEHGVINVDPDIRIGRWQMNLVTGSIESDGTPVAETPKWWWDGWR